MAGCDEFCTELVGLLSGLGVEGTHCRRLRLDAEGVERHGQHLVVPDENTELDEFGVAQFGRERRPGAVGDDPIAM